MNVILENPLANYFHNEEYIRIINVCLASKNESELRTNIKKLFEGQNVADSFEYGLGGNHLWVCEKHNNKRIIFVEF